MNIRAGRTRVYGEETDPLVHIEFLTIHISYNYLIIYIF